MGSWIAGLLGAETAAALGVVAIVLVAYLTTKIHLESKQNAREHAELRRAIDIQGKTLASQGESMIRLEETLASQGESMIRLGETLARQGETLVRQGESMIRLEETLARQGETLARQGEANDRRFSALELRFDSNDRRFNSNDRKLDLLVINLLKNPSDKDD